MNSLTDRANYVNKAISIIKNLSDVEKELYLSYIADVSGVSVSVLYKKLNEQNTVLREEEQTFIATTENIPDATNLKVDSKQTVYLNACRFLLYYLLVIGQSEDKLFDMNVLTDKTHQIIYSYVLDCLSEGRTPNASSVYNLANVDQKEVDAVINYQDNSGTPDVVFEDCLKIVKKNQLKCKRDQLLKKMSNTLDLKELEDIKSQIAYLTLELKKL